MRVETGHDGVKARGEAEIVHLLNAFPGCVLGVDSSSVDVAFRHGFLDLQLLGFFLLLAFLGLALERFGCEFQLHDLVQKLLCG